MKIFLIFAMVAGISVSQAEDIQPLYCCESLDSKLQLRVEKVANGYTRIAWSKTAPSCDFTNHRYKVQSFSKSETRETDEKLQLKVNQRVLIAFGYKTSFQIDKRTLRASLKDWQGVVYHSDYPQGKTKAKFACRRTD